MADSSSTIQHLVETSARNPDYSEREFTPEEIRDGFHRKFIGGHWETHGRHQVDFLREHGLRPDHRFLDIGCGCFRAGRPLVDLLETAHYYGIDANLGLIQAGYDYELDDDQRAKLPVGNLRANDRFNCSFDGVKFDYAIAQSVFTHVSLNHVRLCLSRVAQNMRVGGIFYATFYEQPDSTRLDKLKPGGRHMFTERNPYWYYRDDLVWAASFSPWRVRYIGDWGHPADQRMVEFTRVSKGEHAKIRRAQLPPAQQAQEFVARGRRYLARRISGS